MNLEVQYLRAFCAEAFPLEEADRIRDELSVAGARAGQGQQGVSMIFGAHASMILESLMIREVPDPGTLFSHAQRASDGLQSSVPQVSAVRKIRAYELEIGVPRSFVVILEFEIIPNVAEPHATISELTHGIRAWLSNLGGMTQGQWSPRTPMVSIVGVRADPKLVKAFENLSNHRERRPPGVRSADETLDNALPRNAQVGDLIGEASNSAIVITHSQQFALSGAICPALLLVGTPDGPVDPMPLMGLTIPGEARMLSFVPHAVLAICILDVWTQWAFRRCKEIEHDIAQSRESLRENRAPGDEVDNIILELAPVGATLADLRNEIGGVKRRFLSTLEALKADLKANSKPLRLPRAWGEGSDQGYLAITASLTVSRLNAAQDECDQLDRELASLTSYTSARVTLRSTRTMERLTWIMFWMTAIVTLLTVVVAVRP